MRISFSLRPWYAEYKNHVRIHDYFSFMVNNFPLLVFRRLDFGLHSPELVKCFAVGIFGLCFYWTREVLSPN